jgi:sterol desaturase/sphingolipid hydroxylase (fatty acid hydroxylase superfamily)
VGPVGIVAVATLVLFAYERIAPGVVLPRVPWWGRRVVLANAVQVGVVFLAAATWDRWLPQVRLFDGTALGPVWGAVAGYVAITFVFYWWHRARHEVPWLWRHLHQVHHSPERIEVVMSFYKHPLEILANGVICSALLYSVLGLAPATAAAVLALAGVGELLYHANLRTPHWMGWFFQRPEMHRRHHQRGWHRDNYSDLPVWDLMFGTFHNPREVPAKCGFSNRRELRVWALLKGHVPAAAAANAPGRGDAGERR